MAFTPDVARTLRIWVMLPAVGALLFGGGGGSGGGGGPLFVPCECYGVGLVILFSLRGNVHQALIALLIREVILRHEVVVDVVHRRGKGV